MAVSGATFAKKNHLKLACLLHLYFFLRTCSYRLFKGLCGLCQHSEFSHYESKGSCYHATHKHTPFYQDLACLVSRSWKWRKEKKLGGLGKPSACLLGDPLPVRANNTRFCGQINWVWIRQFHSYGEIWCMRDNLWGAAHPKHNLYNMHTFSDPQLCGLLHWAMPFLMSSTNASSVPLPNRNWKALFCVCYILYLIPENDYQPKFRNSSEMYTTASSIPAWLATSCHKRQLLGSTPSLPIFKFMSNFTL